MPDDTSENWVIISLDNGLLPSGQQAIIQTNADFFFYTDKTMQNTISLKYYQN